VLKHGIANLTNSPHNPQLLNDLGIQVRIVLLVKRMEVSLLWVYAEECFFCWLNFVKFRPGKYDFNKKKMIFHGKTIPNSQPPKKKPNC
jgi:hypothetical protein